MNQSSQNELDALQEELAERERTPGEEHMGSNPLSDEEVMMEGPYVKVEVKSGASLIENPQHES